jgi:hypothetical protein
MIIVRQRPIQWTSTRWSGAASFHGLRLKFKGLIVRGISPAVNSRFLRERQANGRAPGAAMISFANRTIANVGFARRLQEFRGR